MWCRGFDTKDEHVTKLKEGDKVWFKRSNGDAVVAEIEAFHFVGFVEGEVDCVDLTYLAIGEDHVQQQGHKFREILIGRPFLCSLYVVHDSTDSRGTAATTERYPDKKPTDLSLQDITGLAFQFAGKPRCAKHQHTIYWVS